MKIVSRISVMSGAVHGGGAELRPVSLRTELKECIAHETPSAYPSVAVALLEARLVSQEQPAWVLWMVFKWNIAEG